MNATSTAGGQMTTLGGHTVTSIGGHPVTSVTPYSKDINPGRQILQSLSTSNPLLQPHSQHPQPHQPHNQPSQPHNSDGRIETHKIISGPIGMSGTPIILQTALTTLP